MNPMNRRDFLRNATVAIGGLALAGRVGVPALAADSPRRIAPGGHQVMPLPYDAGALQGLSAQLITWHHGRHYSSYVRNRNRIETRLAAMDPAAADFDAQVFAGLRKDETFNAAGQILHEVYFRNLGGNGTWDFSRHRLAVALRREYGSVEAWWANLKATALAAGIGWGVTLWDPSCSRLINVVVESHQLGAVWGATPIVALDGWEHAFYHDFGPEKAAYMDVFFQNLHWDRLDEMFRAVAES